MGEKPFMFPCCLISHTVNGNLLFTYQHKFFKRVVWLSFISQMCVRNGEHYQKLGDISNTKM